MLNRSRWSSRRVARCLFRLLVSTFVPNGPVIIGLNDDLLNAVRSRVCMITSLRLDARLFDPPALPIAELSNPG